MEVEKLIAVAVIAAILIVLLRNSRPEQGMIVSIVTAVLLLLWLLDSIQPILEEIRQLLEGFGFGTEHGEILLKSLGICFLSQTAGDLCRDAGEGSLAGHIELAGKTAVLLSCLPLFRTLLETATGLIR